MLDMKDKIAIDPAPVDVGARFSSREAAEEAVEQLAAANIARAQVEILDGSGGLQVARGAERRATRKALVRWHVLLGAAGAVLGILLWLFAWNARSTLVLAMPALMFFVAAAFPVLVHATDRQQAHRAREILIAAHGDPYLIGAGP